MQNKKKTGRAVLGVILALLFIAVGFTAGWFGRYLAIDSRMRTLMWAADVTEKNFYGEFDIDRFYEDAFGLLRPDDYSRFYSAEEYAELEKESQGSGMGKGFSLYTGKTGQVVLFSVTENSPAEHAGLKRGMEVYRFGKDESSLGTGTAKELLAFAAEHATVTLECGYNEGDVALYTVTSASYAAAYCTYADSEGSFAFRNDGGMTLTDVTETRGTAACGEKTAVIRINEFEGNVASEFKACLELMRSRGRTDLVLDLRSNGGGYIDKLLSVASHLLKNAGSGSNLVLEARYADGRKERYVTKTADYAAYFTESSRIAVLADEFTASASEALIGAMIDYGTVAYSDVIVRAETGKTFGKGIMQSHFRDAAGNAMKLTVATVHWPKSGRCIHGTGINVQEGAASVEAPLFWEEDIGLAYAFGLLSRESV